MKIAENDKPRKHPLPPSAHYSGEFFSFFNISLEPVLRGVTYKNGFDKKKYFLHVP